MSENVTLFGDVADDFDVQLGDAEKALNQYVESHNFSVGSMVLASTTIAFMRFGQTFVDTVRLGNGLQQGGWRGIGSDAMRLLTVAGVAGAAVSRLSRLLVVTQQAGTYTCTWVTTTNALRQTGQRFFASMEQLAQAAGVDLAVVARSGGTTVQEIKNLIEAMKKMGIAVEEVNNSSQQLETLVDLLNARSSGALAFAISYENAGVRAAHQLFATYSSVSGLTITDTTGRLYQSLTALRASYPNAELISESLFFLKNTAIISGAKIASEAGGLAHMVVELLPVAVKGRGTPTPRPALESRRPPNPH